LKKQGAPKSKKSKKIAEIFIDNLVKLDFMIKIVVRVEIS
jgi:hypothetical protein